MEPIVFLFKYCLIILVFCSEDESGDKFEKGVFTWPKTPVGNKANISCPYNSNAAMAYRWCRMKNNSLQKWGSVHDESCSVLETNTSMGELVMKVIMVAHA